MINYTEGIRKQSSESVGLLEKKIVTELCELPKVAQEDRTSIKSEISREKSESSIVYTPSVEGTDDSLVKKNSKSTETEENKKDGTESRTFSALKSSSDVEVQDRILTRVETFGCGSEKIVVVPQRVAMISQESQTIREPLIVRDDIVEVSENAEPSTSPLVINKRSFDVKEYASDYSSSESYYSKSSLNTTNNMLLLRKSPFSTRNGSETSRSSSMSQKPSSFEVRDFKGSEKLTESDWKPLSNKSSSYEVFVKLSGQLGGEKANSECTLGYTESPRPKSLYQVACENSGEVISKRASVSSSESYKLIRQDAMKVVSPSGAIAPEEARIVKRFVLDGSDGSPTICYQQIHHLPPGTEGEKSGHYEMMKITGEPIRQEAAGTELTRDVSATTMGEEEEHKGQNNVGIHLSVKKGAKPKKVKGRVRAMERFNRFFSILRSGIVRHTMILAMMFWMFSFWCLYPSIFSGWLKNEIKYKKGDISGSSVTLIGLSSISRHDSAHLKDGALLSLSRVVTFEDILVNEDELLDPHQGITMTESKTAKDDSTKKDESESKDGKSDNKDSKTGEARSTADSKQAEEGSSGKGDDEKGLKDGKDSSTGKEKEPQKSEGSSDETGSTTSKTASGENDTTKGDGTPKQGDNEPGSIEKKDGTNKDKQLTKDQKKGDTEVSEGEKKDEKATSRNIRRNDKVVDKVNKSLEIYRHCTHERKFIKKSCCFRDMCEVGNLDEEDTRYFKSLYGATVYDIHYREFKNLQKGGKVVMSTATLAMFFLALVLLMPLSRVGAFSHAKLKEAAFNLGIISWVLSIFLSLLGFLIWNHFTGGSVCVDELGRSKPCSLHYGSILFILHIIFEGIGLILIILDSVLLKPKEVIAGGKV